MRRRAQGAGAPVLRSCERARSCEILQGTRRKERRNGEPNPLSCLSMPKRLQPTLLGPVAPVAGGLGDSTARPPVRLCSHASAQPSAQRRRHGPYGSRVHRAHRASARVHASDETCDFELCAHTPRVLQTPTLSASRYITLYAASTRLPQHLCIPHTHPSLQSTALFHPPCNLQPATWPTRLCACATQPDRTARSRARASRR